ncbi:hypothetical protein SCA6_002474 [Theobroma cacao]
MAKKKHVLKEDEEGGSSSKQVSRADFPPDFVFGVATSSYQDQRDDRASTHWFLVFRLKEVARRVAGVQAYGTFLHTLKEKLLMEAMLMRQWIITTDTRFLHPLYFGDYPKSMRERLGDQLPEFTEEDQELLSSFMDFVGLNQYTSRLVSHAAESAEEGHFHKAQQIEKIVEWEDGEMIGEKAASDWLYVVPWGMRKVLNYIADAYSNLPIYITENGMDDEENDTAPLPEMLDDKLRVRFYKGYLAAVAQAINDGVDVRGYFAWSLLDNFEWSHGYTKRFGLVYVDYKNGLTRHPKSSAMWFKQFLKGGGSNKDNEE